MKKLLLIPAIFAISAIPNIASADSINKSFNGYWTAHSSVHQYANNNHNSGVDQSASVVQNSPNLYNAPSIKQSFNGDWKASSHITQNANYNSNSGISQNVSVIQNSPLISSGSP